MTSVLMVGGGAATGRAILEELSGRDLDITLLNRGGHNEGLDPDLELIRADPHFRDSIHEALGQRRWDIAVVTYGRVSHFAEELRGRVDQLVTVSGTPVVAGGGSVPLTERDAVVTEDDEPVGMTKIGRKIAVAEQEVLRGSVEGHYASTVVRYPYVYGPHAVVPMEWHVLQRCLDGRRRWPLHDGGLSVVGRCAAPNAAGLVGAVIDQPGVARGQIYHAADDRQLTQRQWIETLAGFMGHEFDFVDIPPSVAPLDTSAVPMTGELLFVLSRSEQARGILRHHVASAEKARTDLGYTQRVDPVEWMATTVEYELAHPPAVDGSHTSFSPLDFNYDAEDALLAWWDSVVARAPTPAPPVSRGHAYEHPKAAR